MSTISQRKSTLRNRRRTHSSTQGFESTNLSAIEKARQRMKTMMQQKTVIAAQTLLQMQQLITNSSTTSTPHSAAEISPVEKSTADIVVVDDDEIVDDKKTTTSVVGSKRVRFEFGIIPPEIVPKRPVSRIAHYQLVQQENLYTIDDELIISESFSRPMTGRESEYLDYSSAEIDASSLDRETVFTKILAIFEIGNLNELTPFMITQIKFSHQYYAECAVRYGTWKIAEYVIFGIQSSRKNLRYFPILYNAIRHQRTEIVINILRRFTEIRTRENPMFLHRDLLILAAALGNVDIIAAIFSYDEAFSHTLTDDLTNIPYTNSLESLFAAYYAAFNVYVFPHLRFLIYPTMNQNYNPCMIHVNHCKIIKLFADRRPTCPLEYNSTYMRLLRDNESPPIIGRLTLPRWFSIVETITYWPIDAADYIKPVLASFLDVYAINLNIRHPNFDYKSLGEIAFQRRNISAIIAFMYAGFCLTDDQTTQLIRWMQEDNVKTTTTFDTIRTHGEKYFKHNIDKYRILFLHRGQLRFSVRRIVDIENQ